MTKRASPADAMAAAPPAWMVDQSQDINAVLAALEKNNPDDAKAAKAAMLKLKREAQTDPAAAGGDDINAILAALQENNPDDAAAARTAAGQTKRWVA
jgi:hypothetical protein